MEKLTAFLKDSVEEIRTKVSWPKFSELQSSSTLVLVASLIFALLVGLIDFGFQNAMDWFYRSF
jgi:preprotein translocase subunit SecE